jgi:serine/threonine-protein kinase
MGEVWAARSDTDGREVALKVLLARAAMKPDLVRRFRREAEIASAVQSPFVCRLLEVGTTPDGAHLLVFEKLEGESLADRLKREQYLPFNEVWLMIDDVLQGLAAAHAAGVIHRDLKPGNIYLERTNQSERSERAKILDFGISKLRRGDGEQAEPTLTAFDATLGSFAYMAPEQVRGAARADERADIYAAGAVAFRSLSGRLPFEGTTAALLVAMKLERQAPSLAEATGDRWPTGIERFLERALARQRENRFPTAVEAIAAWRKLAPGTLSRGAAAPASPPLQADESMPLPPPDTSTVSDDQPTWLDHASTATDEPSPSPSAPVSSGERRRKTGRQ